MAATRYILYISLCLFGNISLKSVDGKSLFTEKLVDHATAEVASPVTDITRQLKEAMGEIELKKQEIHDRSQDVLRRLSESSADCLENQEVRGRATRLESWNFDSCVKLTDDMKLASEIALEGGQLTLNISALARTLAGDILNCPTWNARDTAKCYNGHLVQLREAVVEFKNVSMPVVTAGVGVIRRMGVDFDDCVGIPVTANAEIEEHLKNC